MGVFVVGEKLRTGTFEEGEGGRDGTGSGAKLSGTGSGPTGSLQKRQRRPERQTVWWDGTHVIAGGRCAEKTRTARKPDGRWEGGGIGGVGKKVSQKGAGGLRRGVSNEYQPSPPKEKRLGGSDRGNRIHEKTEGRGRKARSIFRRHSIKQIFGTGGRPTEGRRGETRVDMGFKNERLSHVAGGTLGQAEGGCLKKIGQELEQGKNYQVRGMKSGGACS